MIILVNPQAHAGKAAARWAQVAPAIARRFPHTARVTASPAEAEAAVREGLASGETVFAAAGGDGTVNWLLNALIDPATDAPRGEVVLGAVGLGSSNDFHKPRHPERDVAGVPVALTASTARWHDVGRADWIDGAGGRGSRYFLLNASLGATAKGNHRYNHPEGLLAFFKGLSPALAIHWGTLEAMAMFENEPIRLHVDGVDAGRVAVSNLGVIKRQHFLGGMRYDTPVTIDDGRFDVNLCHDMSRIEFVRAVMAISGGRFLGLPKTRHWRAKAVHVEPERPTPLELDGEVVLVREAMLRVIPRAIRVCGEE